MAAGISDHVWTLREIAELIDLGLERLAVPTYQGGSDLRMAYIQVGATFCEEVTRDEGTQSLSVSRFVTTATLGLIGGPGKDARPLPVPWPLVVTIWELRSVGPHRLRDWFPKIPRGED